MKKLIAAIFGLFSFTAAISQGPPTRIIPFDLTESYDQSFVGFDSHQYEGWKYERNFNGDWDITGLPFRLLKPLNYNGSNATKYPLVIMLHGAGEAGYDNEHSLKWGGKDHMDAVNSGKYAGFVMFPQEPYGSWSSGNPADTNASNQLQQRYLGMVWSLIDSLASRYNIDRDRVAIHGLSSGGTGTLVSYYHRPDLFASILPMSAAACIGNIYADHPVREYVMRNMGIVAPTPVWWFQGGTDTNPSPSTTVEAFNFLEDSGATNTDLTRYTVYSNRGHQTWDLAYKESDFFPFILRHNKKNIYVMGKSTLCAGETTILGFSQGFYNYQWYKDGVAIAGATRNKLTNATKGTYYVTCQRKINGVLTLYQSNSVSIYSIDDVVVAASQSIVLPSPAGSSVTLSALANQDGYQWSTGATTRAISVSTTGDYSVRITKNGCTSAYSTPIHVQEGPIEADKPAKPTNLKAFGMSSTSVTVTWDDNASNETGYEVYRAYAEAGPYSFMGLFAANTAQFVDNTVKYPIITYYYKVRAVNVTSAALSDNAVSARPTYVQGTVNVPTNVSLGKFSEQGIQITWNAPAVTCPAMKYIVYDGTTQIGTSTTTSFFWTGMSLGEHNFSVALQDSCGNTSGQSFGKYFSYDGSGLFASRYSGMGTLTTLPTFANQTPVTEGWVDQPIIATGTPFVINKVSSSDLVGGVTDNFAVQFRGYVNITSTGTWTFKTRSDDGSKIYIKGTRGISKVIDNNGNHGPQDKTDTVYYSSTGWFPMTVEYYESTIGQELTISYKSPANGSSFVTIPASNLATTPAGIISINNSATLNTFTLTEVTNDKIAVNIVANFSSISSSINTFEFFRATTPGTWTKIATLPRVGNATSNYTVSFKDTMISATQYLSPSTTYYYALKLNGTLSYYVSSPYQSITTGALAISVPTKPTGLTVPKNTNQIKTITFDDNSTNESGFEIWRSTSIGSGYSKMGTSGKNIETYYDSTAIPFTQYYYKARAYNQAGYSDFSGVDSTISTLTFYSKSTGDLLLLSTWGTSTDGSGTAPSNFTSGSQTFIIANRPSGTTISNGWTVSGNGSKLVVNDGQQLTVASGVNLEASMEIKDNAEVTFESDHIPTLTSVASSSTVSFKATSTVPDVDYGHLHFAGSGTKTLEMDSLTVLGDLVLDDAITVQSPSSTGIRLFGDFTLEDTLSDFSNVSITFKGTNHELNGNGGTITLNTLAYPSNATITLTNSSILNLGGPSGGGLYPGNNSVLSIGNGRIYITGSGSINPDNKSGKIAANGATLRINSSSVQNSKLRLDPTACTFKDIHLYNTAGATLDVLDSLNLTSTLKLGAGTFKTNDHVVLVSNVSGTARIAKVEVGASLVGEVRWQRLVGPDKHAAYFHLATPIKNEKIGELKKTIKSIRGLNVAESASIAVMNEATNGWTAIRDSNTIMSPGVGYRVYAFASDFTYPNNSAFYQMKGSPVIGDGQGNNGGSFVMPIKQTLYGWNLLGNPYPCEIDWNATGWDKTNVLNSYQVWDSKNAGYKTYVGGSSPVGTGDLTSVINAGQAFLVKAITPGTSNLSLTENVKVVPSTSPAFFRMAEDAYLLRVNMINNEGISDQTVIRFMPEAKQSLDGNDGSKLLGSTLNIYTLAGQESLSINSLPFYNSEVTVPVVVQANKSGAYGIAFSGIESFDANVQIFLHDKEKNLYVDLRKEIDYTFTKTAAFDDPNRFEFVFQNLPEEQVLAFEDNKATISAIQVSPNPAHTSATFKFEALKASSAELIITNIEGEEVFKTHWQGVTGTEEMRWDIDKQKAPAGMYFFKISAGESIFEGKVIVF